MCVLVDFILCHLIFYFVNILLFFIAFVKFWFFHLKKHLFLIYPSNFIIFVLLPFLPLLTLLLHPSWIDFSVFLFCPLEELILKRRINGTVNRSTQKTSKQISAKIIYAFNIIFNSKEVIKYLGFFWVGSFVRPSSRGIGHSGNWPFGELSSRGIVRRAKIKSSEIGQSMQIKEDYKKACLENR